MKYSQFRAWCNERACDGQWSMLTAIACIDIIHKVDKNLPWKREKAWQKINTEYQIEAVCAEVTP